MVNKKLDDFGFSIDKIKIKCYEQGQSIKDSTAFNCIFFGVVAVVFVLCFITS